MLYNKGFTLIELLVVITIIGILATGAVGIYTSQLQKARDSTRLNDIQTLNTAFQAIYNDTSEFPQPHEMNDTNYGLQKYISVIPGDPRNGNTGAKSAAANSFLAYVYSVGNDSNNVAYGSYELSSAFENSGNVGVNGKARTDNGNDNNRYEIGTLRYGSTNTNFNTSLTTQPASRNLKGVCLPAATAAGNIVTTSVGPAIINGNPTGSNDCG